MLDLKNLIQRISELMDIDITVWSNDIDESKFSTRSNSPITELIYILVPNRHPLVLQTITPTVSESSFL